MTFNTPKTARRNLHDTVIATVKSEAFKVLGQEVGLVRYCLNDLKTFQTLGTFRIAPQMCGPVGIMFETIRCEVFVGYRSELNTVFINYAYTYTHSDGGSNGYCAQTEFVLKD